MDFVDFIKVYGPMGLGWLLSVYLIKFILDRYASDIDARVRLAAALEGLTKAISNGNHESK